MELSKLGRINDLLDEKGHLDLIALGNHARRPDRSVPLIPARFHIMARAINGVYGWFDSNQKIQLLPRRYLKYPSPPSPSGQSCVVFELASCNRCGEVMLVGIDPEKNGGFYQQPPDVGDDPIAELKWYALHPEERESEVDEDDVVEDAVEAEENPKEMRLKKCRSFFICRICGRMGEKDAFGNGNCVDHTAEPIPLLEIPNKERHHWPRFCPSCGNIHGGVAGRILTGRETPAAVLATALYQKIPESHEHRDLPGSGRKLMAFSDSRQDAAFFAPFMENTYNRLKQRRYLVQALESAENSLDLKGWAKRARSVAEEEGEWKEEVACQERDRESQGWVLREWIAVDRRFSLEGIGAVLFRMRKPDRFSGLKEISTSPWSLSPEAQWELVHLLLDSIRAQGTVSFQGFETHRNNALFKPRNSESWLRGAGSDAGKKIYAWESVENRTNRRLDYLYRFLRRKRKLPEETAKEESLKALKIIWGAVNDRNGPLAGLFYGGLTHPRNRREANLFQLKPNWWEVERASDENVFRCGTCGSVTSRALEGLCPLFKCE